MVDPFFRGSFGDQEMKKMMWMALLLWPLALKYNK